MVVCVLWMRPMDGHKGATDGPRIRQNLKAMPKVKFIKHPAGHNMAYSIGDVVEVNSELAKRLLTHGLIEVLSDTTETATAQMPTETATRNRRPKK